MSGNAGTARERLSGTAGGSRFGNAGTARERLSGTAVAGTSGPVPRHPYGPRRGPGGRERGCPAGRSGTGAEAVRERERWAGTCRRSGNAGTGTRQAVRERERWAGTCRRSGNAGTGTRQAVRERWGWPRAAAAVYSLLVQRTFAPAFALLVGCTSPDSAALFGAVEDVPVITGAGGGPSATSSTATTATTATTGAGGAGGQGGEGGSVGPWNAPELAECFSPTDCPGRDGDCQSRTCEIGVCSVTLVEQGVPIADQVQGDCAVEVCDAVGFTESTYDSTDLVPDGDSCTTDHCDPVAGPEYDPLGDAQCRGVCVLAADSPVNDGAGNPVGVFVAGAYATCGLDDVFAPAQPPWEWTFVGIEWDDPMQPGVTRACGDAAGLLAVGLSWSPTAYCETGYPCQAVFSYALPDGSHGTTWRPGTCE